MKENKGNFFIAFIIMYILFGFFPGVKMKYVPLAEFSRFSSLNYFIKNFFHLWKAKLIASIGAVYISHIIKERKLKKYNK